MTNLNGNQCTLAYLYSSMGLLGVRRRAEHARPVRPAHLTPPRVSNKSVPEMFSVLGVAGALEVPPSWSVRCGVVCIVGLRRCALWGSGLRVHRERTVRILIYMGV